MATAQGWNDSRHQHYHGYGQRQPVQPVQQQPVRPVQQQPAVPPPVQQQVRKERNKERKEHRPVKPATVPEALHKALMRITELQMRITELQLQERITVLELQARMAKQANDADKAMAMLMSNANKAVADLEGRLQRIRSAAEESTKTKDAWRLLKVIAAECQCQ
jgi:hypothetical protein